MDTFIPMSKLSQKYDYEELYYSTTVESCSVYAGFEADQTAEEYSIQTPRSTARARGMSPGGTFGTWASNYNILVTPQPPARNKWRDRRSKAPSKSRSTRNSPVINSLKSFSSALRSLWSEENAPIPTQSINQRLSFEQSKLDLIQSKIDKKALLAQELKEAIAEQDILNSDLLNSLNNLSQLALL